MRTYIQLQEQLGTLVGLPHNLPIVYLLGDTGAGKTCLVRQLLGTTEEKFPSVKRVRTTVAPTEFIITNEQTLNAAFVFRPEIEIAQLVGEIIEQAVTATFIALRANDELPELADILGDSPDQRFKLRCFLDEPTRKAIAQDITAGIAPKIIEWAKSNFPNDNDDSTILALALEREFAPDIEDIKVRVVNSIIQQVKAKCNYAPGLAYPETFAFKEQDRTAFIQRLKGFLSVEEGNRHEARHNAANPIMPHHAVWFPVHRRNSEQLVAA